MSNGKRYYTGKAVGHNFDPDTLKVGIKLKITEGQRTGDVGWYNGSLEESWASNTMEALKLCGWDGDVDKAIDTCEFTGLGTTLVTIVEIDHEYPPGVFKPKFRYINAYKPKGAKPAKGKANIGKGLAAKLKAMSKAVQVDIDDSARIDGSPDDNPFG